MLSHRRVLQMLTLFLFLGLGGCVSWFSDDEPEPQVHLVKVEVVQAKLMQQNSCCTFASTTPTTVT
jgi:hypothetical protein